MVAQESAGFWSFGIKTGYSASNHTGDVVSQTLLHGDFSTDIVVENAASDQVRHGFHAELQVERTFSRYFGLGLECGYTQKGAQIKANKQITITDPTEINISSSLMQQQDYIIASLPVTLFIPIGKRRFLLRSGFYSGYLLQSVISGTYESGLFNEPFKQETPAPQNDFGYLLGFGFSWDVSENSFMFLEARYNQSMKPITVNSASYTIQNLEISIALAFK